jgi:predicted nucleic acid-binding protein
MIRLLLDTNVVLDVLLARDPWFADAQRIWQAHRDGDGVRLLVTATTVTDVFYIVRGHDGRDAAWVGVRTCVDQLDIIGVGRDRIEEALRVGGSDFEDDLQIACAIAANLDGIITRDATGFARSPIPILEPAEVVAGLNAD